MKDFDVNLRKLSEHCSFGATLNDSLRDRFVCGLKNESIQKKLLSEKELTYDKAVEIANAMESAHKDVRELHGQSTNVNNLSKSKGKKYQRENKPTKLKEKPKTEAAKVTCKH